MKVRGRPRTEIEERPSCPFCESSNDFVVKAGFREYKKHGKERNWYCNKCNKSWTQERIARDILQEALRITTSKLDIKNTNKDGYLKLIEAIKQGPTFSKNYRRVNQHTTSNTAHTKLQEAALEFLRKQQLKPQKEYRLNLTRLYFLDVVGFQSGKLIAIECGDINSDKQSDFWNFFSNGNAELYWLPFNSGRLFKITPVEGSEQQFSEFRKYSKAHK